MRFTVGFTTTGFGFAAGGKNKGTAFGFGIAFTVGFFGACAIVFLTDVLPLRASIMIWLLSVYTLTQAVSWHGSPPNAGVCEAAIKIAIMTANMCGTINCDAD